MEGGGPPPLTRALALSVIGSAARRITATQTSKNAVIKHVLLLVNGLAAAIARKNIGLGCPTVLGRHFMEKHTITNPVQPNLPFSPQG